MPELENHAVATDKRGVGIYDRDYYRKRSGTGGAFGLWLQTAVGSLIALNVVCWILQVATPAVTEFLSATADQVFGLQIWRLVTANFAHAPNSIYHLGFNMLFLFFFGRELERMYGRRDFYILYLGAGVLAVLAELTVLAASGGGHVPVLGASGSVMAIVVLYTLFYPNRTILFMLFIPMPLWLLCILYILGDVMGALSNDPNGVANWAHLMGAFVGFLYWKFDLRWHKLRAYFSPRSGRRPSRQGRKIVQMPQSKRPAVTKEVDPVSLRIDELLAKISDSGKESLSEDEWNFLKANSGRYRSD